MGVPARQVEWEPTQVQNIGVREQIWVHNGIMALYKFRIIIIIIITYMRVNDNRSWYTHGASTLSRMNFSGYAGHVTNYLVQCSLLRTV